MRFRLWPIIVGYLKLPPIAVVLNHHSNVKQKRRTSGQDGYGRLWIIGDAKTVTLKRKTEKVKINKETNLREIPFYTETVGDIYLAQGHNRLAAQVYRSLLGENSNPRIVDKLDKLEKELNKKD